MSNLSLALGIPLMLLGIALVVLAVFRALSHNWALGMHELWVIPSAGLGLALLGRWMIQ